MKKVLLAFAILIAGAAAFHGARQSTNRLEAEAAALRQALSLETQRLATAQADQADLSDRAGKLKKSLREMHRLPESELWSALQTNRADRLPGKLRERLRDEFGFTWETFKDYIVVSKRTVRDLRIPVVRAEGRLNEAAVTTLAITPEERRQLEEALEKVKYDFKERVLTSVERAEPADDILAQYSLTAEATTAADITNSFFTAIVAAVGPERADLIRESAVNWKRGIGITGRSVKLTVRREVIGDQPRLKFEVRDNGANKSTYAVDDKLFPNALAQLFPNRWADLAKREGFELPERIAAAAK